MVVRLYVILALAVVPVLGAHPVSAQEQGIGGSFGGSWGLATLQQVQFRPRPYAPYVPYEMPGRPPDAGRMSPDGAINMLRGRGFSNISVIRQRGATIILEANGPRGERVELVVDGVSGAISGMRVIGFGNKRY